MSNQSVENRAIDLVATPDRLSKLVAEAAYKALRAYHMSNMVCADDGLNNPYPLVDLLSADGDSIASGESEIELIVSAICDEVSQALAAESEESTVVKEHLTTAIADEDQFGMPESQEPKYGIRRGRLYNRATGELIPLDEPVFIFRARDTEALPTLEGYRDRFKPSEHRTAVGSRADDFARFARDYPERMKWPDTALMLRHAAK